jgi:hypothetical protein
MGTRMKRKTVSISETAWELARRKAFETRTSILEVIEQALKCDDSKTEQAKKTK